MVIFSDKNGRNDILSALNAGAQGFLYAGTDVHLAQQAVSFILEGGSYFPTTLQARRSPAPAAIMSDSSAEAVSPKDNAGAREDQAAAPSASVDLTERQRAVLEHLSLGDSNKVIARLLGIREGTVKVHVRQIMRKLGVANRTQVAIAWASGSSVEARPYERTVKGKPEAPQAGDSQFGLRLVGRGVVPGQQSGVKRQKS